MAGVHASWQPNMSLSHTFANTASWKEHSVFFGNGGLQVLKHKPPAALLDMAHYSRMRASRKLSARPSQFWETCLRLTEFGELQFLGTLKGQYYFLRALFLPNCACRHRSISISYDSSLPCHGRGRGFESRRPRHFFQSIARNWQFASWSNLVQLGQCLSLVEHHANKFALCQPLVRHTRLSVKVERNATVRMT